MRPLALVLFPPLAALPLAAQLLGRPKVDVVVPMPPALGVRITELALIPPGSSDSAELHKILVRQLQASRMIRIKEAPGLDRVALGRLDDAARATLKSTLGPGALLSVKVNGVEPVKTLQKGGSTYNGATYHAITTVVYHVGVELLDLASGKLTVLPPMKIESSQQRDGFNAAPVHPDPDAVRAQAVKVAAKKVLGLVLPWADHRELVFFDDSAFRMKEMHGLVKEKKVAEALAIGRSLLPTDAKPGEAAHLLYDVGILQLLSGNYEEAVALLETAVSKADAPDLRAGLATAQEARNNQQSILKLMTP